MCMKQQMKTGFILHMLLMSYVYPEIRISRFVYRRCTGGTPAA